MKKENRNLDIDIEQEKSLISEFDIVDIKEIEIEDKYIQINPDNAKDRLRVELLTGLDFSDFEDKLQFQFIKNKKLKSGSYLVSYNELCLNNYI